MCSTQLAQDKNILFVAKRNGNVYIMNFNDLIEQNIKYFQPLKMIVGYGIQSWTWKYEINK